MIVYDKRIKFETREDGKIVARLDIGDWTIFGYGNTKKEAYENLLQNSDERNYQ
jgi:precorrin-4 methylase